MPAEDEVRQASEQFYEAVTSMLNGDASGMSDIWSHGATASTMHPLGGRQLGWDAVRESWEKAAEAFEGGSVEVSDLEVSVLGTGAAYTTGVEHVQATVGGQSVSFDIRATNVYAREGSHWRIVHHHTDLDGPLQEALGIG